jgi:hypothetical protein
MGSRGVRFLKEVGAAGLHPSSKPDSCLSGSVNRNLEPVRHSVSQTPAASVRAAKATVLLVLIVWGGLVWERDPCCQSVRTWGLSAQRFGCYNLACGRRAGRGG